MGLLDFLSDLLGDLANLQTYEKPRRVFTRGFVAFCVLVAVFELIVLNQFYGVHGWVKRKMIYTTDFAQLKNSQSN